MRTDELIAALAADTTPPERPQPAFRWALAGAVLIAGVQFGLLIGVRPDIGAAAETLRFCFKFVVTLTLAASAAILVPRLARPDRPAGAWSWLLAAAPTLLAAAVLAELVTVPAQAWPSRLIGSNARHCLTIIPALSIVPLSLFLWALRRGAPRRPGLAGAVAGLLAAGIAATFYAANCTDDSPLFVAVWYPLATALVVVPAGLLGRAVLRW